MNGELGIYLAWGKPGMGKSLDLASLTLELFDDYAYMERKYPELPRRVCWTNMKMAKAVEDLHLGFDLKYWDNPRQIRDLRNVDILWDEIGKDLPADGWKDTPKWLRQVFSHYRKRGNRIFANTQDYMAVDINFRRMVKRAYKLNKVFGNRDISATMPPVKRIWGLITKREFDPMEMEYEKDKRTVESLGWPEFLFIRRRYVDAYDTTAEIPAYMPDSFEHVEIKCIAPFCDFVRVEHKKI